jgi:DNA-binding response OmpR family regulator
MSQSVLVVDDEADLLATYERLVRRWGYRVMAAPSLAAGLMALERDRPDLVIADLRLPDGDGLQLVRAAREATRPPPIIIVTGFPSEALRRAAVTAGAAAFLAKPFMISTLLELVHSALAYPPCGPRGPGWAHPCASIERRGASTGR